MINYDEDWLFLLIFRYRGSVSFKASSIALPAAIVCVLIKLAEDRSASLGDEIGVPGFNAKASHLWTATTVVLILMLNVRTNRAISRFWEGTGLLHQMRGEWFDSVSCCVTFSSGAKKKPEREEMVQEFRHTIVRLMSLCHASALEEIAGNHDGPPPAIDTYGLNDATLRHLKRCCPSAHRDPNIEYPPGCEPLNFNRVEVILHMTQTLIVQALHSGVLAVPPPILSRVFQTLSRGFVNLLNAKKITDTRFPFPYAQLLSFLLLLHVVVTPVLVSGFIDHIVWAPIFTFIPVFGMCTLNYVAIELENPFGDDDNDLPLLHFQKEMNNCLLMLLEDKADTVASISEDRCIMDCSTLVAKLQEQLSMSPVQHNSGPRFSLFDEFEAMQDEKELLTERLGLSETPEATPVQSLSLGGEVAVADSNSVHQQPQPQLRGAVGSVADFPKIFRSPTLKKSISKGARSPSLTPVIAPAMSSATLASSIPPQQQLARMMSILDKSVERVYFVEVAFQQWIERAEDHAAAVRRNTEALPQLIMMYI